MYRIRVFLCALPQEIPSGYPLFDGAPGLADGHFGSHLSAALCVNFLVWASVVCSYDA